MKKSNFRYLVFIGILLVSTLVKAQQDPQFTHYMYNMNVINPAYATDAPGVINLGGLYRTQWVGAVGAPKTGTLFVHSPIAKRVEVGLSFVNDAIGDIVHENNIYADVAYVIPLSESKKLSFGVKGGVTLFDVNFDGFELTDPNPDPAFSENVNKAFPNVGAGAFYFSDHYYLGFLIPFFSSRCLFDKKFGTENHTYSWSKCFNLVQCLNRWNCLCRHRFINRGDDLLRRFGIDFRL